MAIFLFIFAGLCGVVAGFLSMMLLNVGVFGGVGVFFFTCYLVALAPFLVDLMTEPEET